MRVYDPRIGRFLSVDPIIKEYESPYAAFANNPIWLSDVNGADTTLPAADGNNITLPTGATFETFQANAKYVLPSNGKEVNAVAGRLRSFTLDGTTYNAVYNTETLAFEGYQDANRNSIVQTNTFTPNFYDQWGHQGASFLSASLTYNATMRVKLYLNPLQETKGLLDAGRITANEASLTRYTLTLRTRKFLDPLGKALSGGLKSEALALAQYQRFINTPGADASKIFNTRGWVNGTSRFLRVAGPVLTVATEGVTYYTIIKHKLTIEQVEDMYTPGNPMLWFWRPIENWLKTLGPKN